ncbi:MAG: MBL fold metallo-hydrolase [Chloroflexota bacterium]|nr:MBL fold metallo-hydrolase [Chloroflexota bacterium]
MIVVRSLGSGSSGNAIVVDAGAAAIMVDCGVNPRALGQGLRAMGRRLTDLSAVLLTHEHTDHVRSLSHVVANNVPIVATRGTARATMLPLAAWKPIRNLAPVTIDGIEVTSLSVSHDAAEPCGYHLRHQGSAVTILTDLGVGHESLHSYLAGSDLIVLEANHDVAMLQGGPYPAHLKRRVSSRQGHLSNADCGATLTDALPRDGRARTIWLAHLSTTNNRPGLAEAAVSTALQAAGLVLPVLALPRYDHHVAWSSVGCSTPPAAQLGFNF